MANKTPIGDPQSPLLNGSNRFRRGFWWVLLRRVARVICWPVRVILGHKIYLLSLVIILLFIFLSWGYLFGGAGIVVTFDTLSVITPAGCRAENNAFLVNQTELEKANGAAATTLVTLLPALLIFAPFPTPRISSLIVFSTSAALVTSAITLGLATSSIITLPKERILRVIDICTEATISQYESIGNPGRPLDELYIPKSNIVSNTIDTSLVPETQRLITGAFLPVRSHNNNTLRDIMLRAVFDRKRPTRIRITVLNVGFFVIQAGLLYLIFLVAPFIISLDVFWMCWELNDFLMISWIGGTAFIGGIIRTGVESSRISKVEILHLQPLSSSCVFESCDVCASVTIRSPHRATGPIVVPGGQHWQQPPTGIYQAVSPTPKPFRYSVLAAMILRRVWAAQSVGHGMVVVLRHSEAVDRPAANTRYILYRVFGGLVQVLLLLLMTILLGGTYGGDIIMATIFLAFFLSITIISRTYSIHFCSWMERALDTVQIEYDTPEQLHAIRTILSGMPSVAVRNVTTGNNYGAGISLVHKTDCMNDASRITNHRTRIIRNSAILLSGSIVGGIMIAIVWLFNLISLFSQARGIVNLVYWVVESVFFVCFVIEKIYSDFEFIETHGESMEDDPEINSPV